MWTTKPKIAFFDFTGCQGCQHIVIDSLISQPEILEVIEIVNFRGATSKTKDDYLIAFIEGSCSSQQEEESLKSIRQQAQTIIALGACAHIGGVNVLRNWQSQDHVHNIVYGKLGKHFGNRSPRPINAIIQVDNYIPGCPINKQEFTQLLNNMMIRGSFTLPDYPICVECHIKGNNCLLKKQIACLGPITRAGCEAICPTYGTGCTGCRGTFTEANLSWLKFAFRRQGLDEAVYTNNMKRFLSYRLNGWSTSGVA